MPSDGASIERYKVGWCPRSYNLFSTATEGKMDSHECRESIPLENLPRPPSFEETDPPAYVQAVSPTPVTPLRRSRWPFGPAVFYAFFALFS
jgi:hypothetical protein